MFNEILLPVDLQETQLSERAAKIAEDLAKRYGSRITLLTVIPDFGLPLVANYFSDEAMKQAEREVFTELKSFVAGHFNAPEKVCSHVDEGTPHDVVVEYAKAHATDLIIVPARAKDFTKMFLGSCSTHIVEHAPCSVMVVRP